MEKDLKEYVRLVLEGRPPTYRLRSGEVDWGSQEHIMDLETRIKDLAMWRDASPKGSDKRANYQRLIVQLRNELRAARRSAEKNSAMMGG